MDIREICDSKSEPVLVKVEDLIIIKSHENVFFFFGIKTKHKILIVIEKYFLNRYRFIHNFLDLVEFVSCISMRIKIFVRPVTKLSERILNIICGKSYNCLNIFNTHYDN